MPTRSASATASRSHSGRRSLSRHESRWAPSSPSQRRAASRSAAFRAQRVRPVRTSGMATRCVAAPPSRAGAHSAPAARAHPIRPIDADAAATPPVRRERDNAREARRVALRRHLQCGDAKRDDSLHRGDRARNGRSIFPCPCHALEVGGGSAGRRHVPVPGAYGARRGSRARRARSGHRCRSASAKRRCRVECVSPPASCLTRKIHQFYEFSGVLRCCLARVFAWVSWSGLW